MKVALCTLALAASASAFAPVAPSATKSSALSYAPELDDMIGADVETGKKIFDPLNLSEYVPPSYARAAEIANGRSAMLATVGWFWPAKIGMFDSTDVTTTDPMKAILEADPQWWAQFIIFCATIEGYKYREGLNGKSSTGGGEPVIDYLKGYPKDEAGRRAMELKELKNGRLAMLGIASFVSAHYIPGSVPLLPAAWTL